MDWIHSTPEEMIWWDSSSVTCVILGEELHLLGNQL